MAKQKFLCLTISIFLVILFSSFIKAYGGDNVNGYGTEKCVNVAGTWTGTATFEDEIDNATLYLSQNQCEVTGALETPIQAECEIQPYLIIGHVSGNIFSATVPEEPEVDDETCEVICYGTGEVTLIVDGDRMYGKGLEEDCIEGGYYEFTVELKRVGSEYSFETIRK